MSVCTTEEQKAQIIAAVDLLAAPATELALNIHARAQF